jgi:hypothetical protein
LLGKPIIDGDILSLNPSMLAHLLPERLQEDRNTRSSAIIQETYAEDFSCLLRVGGNAKRKEQSAKRKAKEFFSHGFSITLVADAWQHVYDSAIGQDRPPNVSDNASTNDYHEQLSRLF